MPQSGDALPVMQRILQRTEVTDCGYESACWIWAGSTDRAGYGQLSIGSRTDGSYKPAAKVHRVGYEAMVGAIPAGLEIDHLCRVKRCWNPDHLEPVTHEVNMQRCYAVKTHCAAGHPLADRDSRGNRCCKRCTNERQNAWARAKREALVGVRGVG